MKRWICFLFFGASLLYSQGQPNCSQTLNFTSAAPGASINTTAGATAGCAGWRLTWSVTGFTSATIQIEGSQNNSTWATVDSSLVQEGTNPTSWNSSTISNTIVVRASFPYVRVNVAAVSSGTGTIKTTLLGYSGTSAQWDVGNQNPGTGFVPYVGATRDLNMGTHQVTASQFNGPAAAFVNCTGTASSGISGTASDPVLSLSAIGGQSPCLFDLGTLTTNITSLTINNKTAGALFWLSMTQATSGGPYTFTPGASVSNNVCQISQDATDGYWTAIPFQVQADATTIREVGCVSIDPKANFAGDVNIGGNLSIGNTVPPLFQTVSPLGTTDAPTVAVVGTPGSITISYAAVWLTRFGSAIGSANATITNAPDDFLSSSVNVTGDCPTGVQYVDIYRQATSGAFSLGLIGEENCSTPGPVSDIGQSASYYGFPSVDTSGGLLISGAVNATGGFGMNGESGGLQSNTGSDVVGLGYSAAYGNTGSDVVGLGYSAAYGNTGSDVVGLGYSAASGNTGSDVVGLGYYATESNTGPYVAGIGVNAAYGNTGSYVAGIGYYAAYGNTGGSDVVGIGRYAASGNTGSYVLGLGYAATYGNTGFDVVGIGYSAAENNTGSYYTRIGHDGGDKLAGDFDLIAGDEKATPIGESSANPSYFGGTLYNVSRSVVLGTSAYTQLNSSALPTVGTFSFTGTGTDDATAGGTYAALADGTYTVTIDGGNPDTFTWVQSATGATLTAVPVTGRSQLLADGFTVTFASATGHTVGDKWVSTVTASTNPLDNDVCVLGTCTGPNQVRIGNSTTTSSVFGGAGGFLSGGSANTVVCWKTDGVTLGYATVAEITVGTCH